MWVKCLQYFRPCVIVHDASPLTFDRIHWIWDLGQMASMCGVCINRLDMMRRDDVMDDYYCQRCIVQPMNLAMLGCYVRAMDLEI